MTGRILTLLSVVLAYLAILLAKQKKQDFRPKDDDVSLTTLQTPVSINNHEV